MAPLERVAEPGIEGGEIVFSGHALAVRWIHDDDAGIPGRPPVEDVHLLELDGIRESRLRQILARERERLARLVPAVDGERARGLAPRQRFLAQRLPLPVVEIGE